MFSGLLLLSNTCPTTVVWLRGCFSPQSSRRCKEHYTVRIECNVLTVSLQLRWFVPTSPQGIPHPHMCVLYCELFHLQREYELHLIVERYKGWLGVTVRAGPENVHFFGKHKGNDIDSPLTPNTTVFLPLHTYTNGLVRPVRGVLGGGNPKTVRKCTTGQSTSKDLKAHVPPIVKRGTHHECRHTLNLGMKHLIFKGSWYKYS